METYRAIIIKEFEDRMQRNRNYSLRSFANNIGIDHGALSQLLSGKRVPSFKMMQKLTIELNLEGNLVQDFQYSIAKTHSKRSLKRLNPNFRKILKTGTDRQQVVKNIELEKFRVIADWYHYAIFVMIQKDNFSYEVKEIAHLLNIKPFQIEEAIERLKLLNLICEKKGILECNELHIDTANKEVTTSAHKKRQKQILTKAIEAIDKQDIKERNNATMTMAIDPKKIPEAKKKIFKFMDELCEFLESGDKKEVYEFSTALFSLEK